MSRKFIYLFILSLVPLMGTVNLALTHNKSPKLGTNYALFFAVDTYDDLAWKDLKNPIRDAEAIARELEEVYQFETEIIRNPTGEQIIKELIAWKKRRFQKDDQLFVFFSGHGIFNDDFKRGYFVPKEGINEDIMNKSHLDLSLIGNVVTQIPCEHILLAIDACYSGTIDPETAFKGKPTFTRPLPSPDYDSRQTIIEYQLRNNTRLVLTSGGKERTPDGRDHSPFAGAILKALRKAYVGGDGMVTYTNLKAQMERVSPKPFFGKLQGHKDGGFIFVGPAIRDLPGPPMAYVSGGTFQMGCTSEQKDCYNDETVHNATISSFYMGKYEVTFDEYDEFCAANQRDKPSVPNWGRDKRPVINIDWYDAIEYCNWLSVKIGYTPVYTINKSSTDPNNSSSHDSKKWTVTANWQANGFRLPTEAEWEYAARQRGQKVLFGNGKNILDPTEVSFNSSSSYKKSYSKAGEFRAKTVPVGSLNSPNSIDLHDMSGNVWEWCWDWKKGYPTNPPKDYKGPTSGIYRVIRGGSWSNVPRHCRVALRYNYSPSYRDLSLGFRLARNG